MTVRLTAAILLLLAFASAAAAQDGNVRVVLPLPLDAKPDTTFERVGPGAAEPKQPDVADICNLIAASADEHGLPRPFFARLIWKESRFDADAVSPTGAQGVAQFMPGTAFMRGLRDAFDPEQAIPASAKYLADLRRDFGNLGLAAAAYNAGEERVSGWLAGGGFLPAQTEDYVLSILGRPADEFRDLAADEEQKPLDEKKPFEEACRALPVMRTAAAPFAGTPKRPGVPRSPAISSRRWRSGSGNASARATRKSSATRTRPSSVPAARSAASNSMSCRSARPTAAGQRRSATISAAPAAHASW